MTTVVSWALFDFANTFFAVAMLTFHFPLWVVEDRGGSELIFSLALGVSMACVGLLMPFCGAISDASGQRMRYLRWTTYGCVVATFLMGFLQPLWLALVLFGIANICYQLGTVFYDALLWRVAPAGRVGVVSGFGAAFGYLGSMAGLLFLWPFARMGGHQATFAPSAIFFLIFALPSFLTIKDDGQERRPVQWAAVVRAAALRLAMTVRHASNVSGLWRYLWASFFSANAINTILIFMAIYTKKVMGFNELQIIQFFVVSQACSIAGAVFLTRLIPRWGSQRTLLAIWSGWILALGAVTASPSLQWLWVIGPTIGVCLGATWATARVLLIELSPKEQIAEMVGLAGLVSRFSSILGPIAWGVLVSDPRHYRHATGLMMMLLAIGVWLLWKVPNPDFQARRQA